MPHETWCQRGVHPQVKAAAGGLVSCPFCPRTAEYPAVAAHLQCHQRSMVRFEGYDIYKCHLTCLKEGHYHCDMCEKAIMRKELFEKHLKKCFLSSRQRQAVTVASDHLVPVAEAPMERVAPVCPPPIQHQSPERVTCIHCHVVMNRKNLKAHMLRKHSGSAPEIHAGLHLPSTCIDPGRGLFAVARSFHALSRPIHVRKCTWGRDRVTQCQLDRCRRAREVSRRRGLLGHECQHLRSVAHAPPPAAPHRLRREALLQMAARKLVSRCVVEACLKRQQEAEAEGTPATAMVALGKEQLETYVSVFEPRATSYSKLGRVLVQYNRRADAWRCPCVTTAKSCLHKSLAKWQLYQLKPELFSEAGEDEESPALGMEVVAEEAGEPGEPGEPGPASAIPLYPPEGEELRGLLQYIIGHKAVPPELPGHVLHAEPLSDVPTQLFPHETHCAKCEERPPLSEPAVITTKAKVVSFLGVVEDVTTYFKRCSSCGSFYRYQEWTQGLHNFNDHLLVTLHLCVFLRNSVKNHTAVGRVLDTLAATNNTEYPDQEEILQAYLHFEALTAHDYSYSCVSCGPHPPVVIMDVHKKGVLSLRADEVEKPPPGFNGWVDCEDFWLSTAEEILGQGFVSCDSPNQLRVLPSYHKWAPWIGRSTRRSDMLLNTEYSKGRVGTRNDRLQETDLEITEERLAKEIGLLKVKDIRELVKSCGLDAGGSKFDLVLQLKEGMKRPDIHDRVVEEIWDSSGGWAIVMCPCAVVYAIKFNVRPESPRDHADLLLSFKHFPNVVICDFARRLATHAGLRQPDAAPFHPFEGKVAEATAENLESAGRGELQANLPWLLSKAEPPEVNGHPYTGSAARYALLDAPHGAAGTQGDDLLRDVGLVPELRGRVNPEVAEEFISKMRENNYFVELLSPGSHMFMMRCLVHLHNNDINRQTLELLGREVESI